MGVLLISVFWDIPNFYTLVPMARLIDPNGRIVEPAIPPEICHVNISRKFEATEAQVSKKARRGAGGKLRPFNVKSSICTVLTTTPKVLAN
jgi:hypothetical protein